MIENNPYFDNRGTFKEILRKNFLQDHINFEFCQLNQVISKKNILRGLHFQKPPHAQSKLIFVSSGKILDVVVDIRKDSKTYKKYFSKIISEKNNYAVFIPKGFAHGYLSLEDNTIVNYLVDEYYNPKSESGIIYNDKTINIDWGINDDKIIISKKDKQHKDYKW